jgi:membrane associated rhomboid family serine protease
MRLYPGNRENEPLRYYGRVPVYAATILAALYCVGLIVTVVFSAAKWPLDPLVFSTEDFFLHGRLWELPTCTFINYPSFFFPFGVFFLYRFCVEIEQYFGRHALLKLYALLLATIALVLGVWRLAGVPGLYSGMNEVTIGMFIAYATLYPGLEFLGWVPLKYVAFICIAVDALSYVSLRSWPGLTVMLAICGVSFGFVRYAKLGGSLEFGDWARRLNPFRRRPKFRVLPSPAAPAPRAGGFANMASVDVILDKIARSGFASLTQDERDQLEQARDILNKKRQ